MLDLGSGAGFDAFLAARQVGPAGFVLGVDMTREMVARARANAAAANVANVEFRLGDIEHLPVDAESVDVIMSNCVINLAPDKASVFREAFRVLAPGGRLAISDVVATAELPASLAGDVASYTGCIAGAARVGDLEDMIAEAGFGDVRIQVRSESRQLIGEWAPGTGAERFVASALIEATKPRSGNDRESGARESIGPGESAPACCDSMLLQTCCSAEQKPVCCGHEHETGTCGCGNGAG